MSSKYDPAIDRGIALLDAKVPAWCMKMQLDHLDLADAASCVLGQVYQEQADEPWEAFDVGLVELGLTDEEEDEYGFSLDRFAEYPALTRRWKQRIRQHCEAHS